MEGKKRPKPQGLDKSRILKKNRQFRHVYKHGSFKVNTYAVIYKLPSPQEPSKIGFVTGKKVGCAVQRNRVRRLMREVYRLHQHEIKEGYHIVWVARQMLRDVTYAEAEHHLLQLLKKSKLLR